MTAVFAEQYMAKTREALVRTVDGMMRDEGYIPLYDVNPVWSTDYKGGDKFTGSYVAQGVFVGEEKAWQYKGMMDGKLVPSTPPSK
jgi:hypothetical protein